MNKENTQENQNGTPTVPQRPSILSVLTESIVKTFVDAALSGLFLYLIWNFTLSQELHLPQFSYAFFACAALFARVLLYKPSEAVVIAQLFESNRNLRQLVQVTSFGIAMNGLKNSEDIMNILDHPPEKVQETPEKDA